MQYSDRCSSPGVLYHHICRDAGAHSFVQQNGVNGLFLTSLSTVWADVPYVSNTLGKLSIFCRHPKIYESSKKKTIIFENFFQTFSRQLVREKNLDYYVLFSNEEKIVFSHWKTHRKSENLTPKKWFPKSRSRSFSVPVSVFGSRSRSRSRSRFLKNFAHPWFKVNGTNLNSTTAISSQNWRKTCFR